MAWEPDGTGRRIRVGTIVGPNDTPEMSAAMVRCLETLHPVIEELLARESAGAVLNSLLSALVGWSLRGAGVDATAVALRGTLANLPSIDAQMRLAERTAAATAGRA